MASVVKLTTIARSVASSVVSSALISPTVIVAPADALAVTVAKLSAPWTASLSVPIAPTVISPATAVNDKLVNGSASTTVPTITVAPEVVDDAVIDVRALVFVTLPTSISNVVAATLNVVVSALSTANDLKSPSPTPEVTLMTTASVTVELVFDTPEFFRFNVAPETVSNDSVSMLSVSVWLT